MLNRWTALLAFSLFLPGCMMDADGDGLSNQHELELGLDPDNADTDGDGLRDGEDPFPTYADIDNDRLNDLEELGWGTDPSNPDTDDDGYLDGDELYEATDPLDPDSRIYQGGWPYRRDGEEPVNRRGASGPLAVGDRFPSIRPRDQFGDKVDLWDFAGDDRPYDYIAIVAQAEWCGPSRNLESWLAGDDDPYGLEADYADVREAVKHGRVMWISVMNQDSTGAPGDLETVERWTDDFPGLFPVFADKESVVEDAIIGAMGGWPSGVVLDARTMRVETMAFAIPDLIADVQDRL